MSENYSANDQWTPRMSTDASTHNPITTKKTTVAQKMVIGQKAHGGAG